MDTKSPTSDCCRSSCADPWRNSVSRSGVIVGAGLILAGLGVASASTTIEPSAVAWVPGAALVVAGVAAMLALRKR